MWYLPPSISFMPHSHFLFLSHFNGCISNSVVDADKQAHQTLQTLSPDKGRAEGLIRVIVLLHAGQSRQSWSRHTLQPHILENFASIIITWAEQCVPAQLTRSVYTASCLYGISICSHVKFGATDTMWQRPLSCRAVISGKETAGVPFGLLLYSIKEFTAW